jgi:hypothetical protein
VSAQFDAFSGVSCSRHRSAWSVFSLGPRGVAGTKGLPNSGTIDDVQLHKYNCSTRRHPPHVTLCSLPQRATVLPRHAHGVLPFFDQARRINQQHALGGAHLLRHQALGCLAPRGCLPAVSAQAAWHPPDAAPYAVQGHGRDRLACEGTHLADPGVEERLAGLASRQTPPALVMERLECVKQSVDLPWSESKLRDGAPLAFRSICR